MVWEVFFLALNSPFKMSNLMLLIYWMKKRRHHFFPNPLVLIMSALCLRNHVLWLTANWLTMEKTQLQAFVEIFSRPGRSHRLTLCFPQGELRISVLPTYLSYDAPWPVRKIPLRCTVHYVSYHVESKARLLSLSTHCTKARLGKNPNWNKFPASTCITRGKIKAYWLKHFEKVWDENPLALKFSCCKKKKNQWAWLWSH